MVGIHFMVSVVFQRSTIHHVWEVPSFYLFLERGEGREEEKQQ